MDWAGVLPVIQRSSKRAGISPDVARDEGREAIPIVRVEPQELHPRTAPNDFVADHALTAKLLRIGWQPEPQEQQASDGIVGVGLDKCAAFTEHREKTPVLRRRSGTGDGDVRHDVDFCARVAPA